MSFLSRTPRSARSTARSTPSTSRSVRSDSSPRRKSRVWERSKPVALGRSEYVAREVVWNERTRTFELCPSKVQPNRPGSTAPIFQTISPALRTTSDTERSNPFRPTDWPQATEAKGSRSASVPAARAMPPGDGRTWGLDQILRQQSRSWSLPPKSEQDEILDLERLFDRRPPQHTINPRTPPPAAALTDPVVEELQQPSWSEGSYKKYCKRAVDRVKDRARRELRTASDADADATREPTPRPEVLFQPDLQTSHGRALQQQRDLRNLAATMVRRPGPRGHQRSRRI